MNREFIMESFIIHNVYRGVGLYMEYRLNVSGNDAYLRRLGTDGTTAIIRIHVGYV